MKTWFVSLQLQSEKEKKKENWSWVYLPGVPGRFLFFLVCWLVEALVLQAAEGPEVESWSWFCGCWCWVSWRTSSPLFPEEKLPSSPETFDIGKGECERLIEGSVCLLWCLYFLVLVMELTKSCGLFFGVSTLPLEEDKSWESFWFVFRT